MSTLVIHPKDESTDFLSVIYKDRTDWTIIRDGKASKTELIKNIKSHDRIIMMGHGTYYGLLGVVDERLIISPKLVYLLRDKYCIGIWCHANLFFEKYKLKGKYTGMIISEVDEALHYDVPPYGQTIPESNKLFAEVMSEYVADIIPLNEALERYKDENNPIITYNRQRIFETNSK